MKNLLKLFTVLLIAVYFSSCTEDFNEINKNPKALTLASLDQASYGFVFKKAIMGTSYLQSAGNGMQLLHSLYFDIYANYWATTTPNFLSDRYVMVGSWLNGAFNSFYAGEAAQIKYSEDFARKSGLESEKAMAKIWKVWAYHRYTDALGPIPYSKYGNMEKTVPYDKQQDIYTAFFLELDSAENILKSASGVSATLSKYDMIYGGNLAKWRKFGNSLHLRLAMRIKYVDAAKAKAEAEKAVANGIIADNADNGWITTSTDFQNPYNIISPWAEYRMSADMESILKGYLDPRAASYFKAAKTPDNTDDPAGVVFPYEGVRNGQTKSDRSTYKFDEIGSDHAAPYTVVGAAGPKWFVMRAFEGYFLRAEGVLEGWNMGGGTVQSLYEEGIKTSFAENGIAEVKNLKSEDYLTSTLVPASPGLDKRTLAGEVAPAPASTAPIAYLSGGTKEQQLEQIITQKWIALLPDSQEAYAERRRTGYPKLYPRLESENPDVAATSLPVRLTYWTSEYTNNKAEVDKAIALLNGESATPNGDKATTKLWWDKK